MLVIPDSQGTAGRDSISQRLSLKLKTKLMKNKILPWVFLAIAIFGSGCDRKPTAAQQIDQVNTETKQAAEDMKNYTFAQKTEFVAKMQVQIDTLNTNLEELSAKIDRSSDAVKAEAGPKLQALRDQVTQLNQQLEKAKTATESTWDDVKGGFQKAYDATRDGFNQARQWVSDKIAP